MIFSKEFSKGSSRVKQQDIEVRNTAIGMGVFSLSDFDAHEIVGEVKGKIFPETFESDYCMDLGNARLEPQAPFRYLNHSCEPNCELVLWKKRKKKGRRYRRLWVQTTRPLKAGEQLTIDYAWAAEYAIPCRCLSRHCRGWIVHPDEAERLPPVSAQPDTSA
jgi:hypothetical protein